MERHNRRIVQLKLEYEQTVASAERACGELLAGDLREADESRAYRNALVGERAAMDAYQKAVLGLAEVMLRGGLRTD